MKYWIPVLLLFIISFHTAFAQPSLSRMQSKLQLQPAAQTGIDFKMINATQAGILFKGNFNLAETQARQWLEAQLETRPDADAFRMDENVANTGMMEVKKMHQYYKGIKVEHGTINVTGRNGKIAMMQLEFYPVSNDFNTRPSLSENNALQKAIEFTGAIQYEWADSANAVSSPNAPHAELVIVKDYETENGICLAYKFEIFALAPVSAGYVYVNAWNGKVVLDDPLIKHADHGDEPGDGHPVKNTVLNYNNTNDQGHAVDEQISHVPEMPLTNPILYSNSQGAAATRYNGIQFIYTDNNSGVAGKPYRLRETRNNMNIETYNFQFRGWNQHGVDNYPLAVDWTDNDNQWTDAEYNNADWDNAALSVHFNMQVISDYWNNIHHRNSWDNAFSPIKSYVHVQEYSTTTPVQLRYLQNAFWYKNKMSFGDGSGDPTNRPPYAPLDVSAHELGHAITQTTSGLIYQWESGALNESFSDIWAACITYYAKAIYPLSGEDTWRIGEKCKNINMATPGFRDMSNPPILPIDAGTTPHPSTYKDVHWRPASLQTCRVFTNANDICGVHANSGVLNKWFFLITQGEAGSNSFGTHYNVAGLGFITTEKIAYLTSLNLTPNASYQTCRTVSLNATASLFGNTSAEYQTVWNAWVAVAVDSNVYNMSNTPVFSSNNFTSIAVGKNGIVLAGTNYSGVYKYAENSGWEKMTDLTDVRFNDIKADYKGDFWIAQSGRTGTQGGGSSIAGGVSYYKYPFTSAATLYTVGAQTDVPSRNGRCIYIDTFRNTALINPAVWVATTSYITSNASTDGMLGHGLNLATPAFTSVNGHITLSGTAGCLTLGGNKTTIWTFVQANNGINQLLTYDAVTNAFIESFDHNTHPTIPSGFVARSIYCDAKGRTWIGLATGGIIVYDENHTWHYNGPANFPALFPAGSQASYNAIAGTKTGDVYIGTTAGLVFFERGDGLIDKIDQPTSYKAFGKPNGLPSNVINAIAYDTSRFKLLVATDSGIVFWEPLCINPYCRTYRAKIEQEDAETVQAGNWSNPATWSNNKIPDSLTNVTIKHNITIDINGECSSIKVLAAATLTVNTGKNLLIYELEKEDIINDSERIRQRR